ncbi:terminase large subunit domain-containing protein [Methylobacter sp. S3L5C]|uniref:terminase large subunit domain-containing protein n=1 Tax=Methylobacter sp. S3L5C TaxID=2839024 RepID=UPI001FAD83DB|nr:terminase family protein [Methylobacter sp. S3L5C]UOA08597.1 terminase family protein [Methylobacter sp. S3L5C]
MGTKRYPAEVVNLCKQFFVKGWTIKEISAEMHVDERTLYNWQNKDGWKEHLPSDSVEIVIARRINVLAEREHKTPNEIIEFEKLCTSFGTLKLQIAEANALASGKIVRPAITDFDTEKCGPAKTPRYEKKTQRQKKTKNDISGITEELINSTLHSLFYGYQLLWWWAKNNPETRRNRFILKSRQIGATYYFAFEALADAILTGENQIFLSASRDQAEVFKAYIIAFALEHFDVELNGQGVITLSNGAELRFLSTNSRTAQSYHGHLYVDECFWIPDFDKMWKVASGMAAHKKWRRTLFSTPSAISHQAYPMWSGEKHNRGRSSTKQAEFLTTHKALEAGLMGADKIWRHMVTVVDAEKQGCDLFDIEELKTEYNKDDFANLFMCKFIDDAKSVFNLAIMMSCYALEDYSDYNDKAPRPFGNRPVAIGYDPSRTRDNASLSILAIPLRPQDKWRVLKTLDYHGQNFQYQANQIKAVVDSHNVQHIGIDVTGIGYGLFELVEQFYRKATPINYSNDTKTALVMKAIDVIENGRFEYESGNKQITQAFMMITKTTTGSGMITYASGRNSATGHADVAWSVLHALHYEPIAPKKKTTVTLSH